MWHDLGLWFHGMVAGIYIMWYYNKCNEKEKRRKERKKEWESEE